MQELRERKRERTDSTWSSDLCMCTVAHGQHQACYTHVWAHTYTMLSYTLMHTYRHAHSYTCTLKLI